VQYAWRSIEKRGLQSLREVVPILVLVKELKFTGIISTQKALCVCCKVFEDNNVEL
jgi:hypothetical protein